MTRLQDLQQQLDDLMNSKPETGEQWAEICWLEAELEREIDECIEGNSQFGVGA